MTRASKSWNWICKQGNCKYSFYWGRQSNSCGSNVRILVLGPFPLKCVCLPSIQSNYLLKHLLCT